MNYQYLMDKPTRFASLTGYTLEEFSSLLPHFTKHFLEFYATKTLDGKPRIKRRYSTYKSSCLPSFEDKLLFILVYLRKATTQDVQGELFGMSQPVAHKWIHRLLPVLNGALAELGELPSRETYVPADISTDNQVSELFFSWHRASNPASQRRTSSLIIVVKRNNIPSRITLLAMLRAKSCY